MKENQRGTEFNSRGIGKGLICDISIEPTMKVHEIFMQKVANLRKAADAVCNNKKNCGADEKRKRGGQKMTHEEFVEKMAQLQPGLIVVGNYINKRTKIRCKCRTCGFEWEALPQGFYKSKGCLQCNGFYRRTHEEFVQEISKINPDVEVLGTCQNVSTKVECRCRTCGYKWMARPEALLRGSSCVKCQHTKMRKTHDAFVAEITAVLPNVLIIGKYAGNDHTIRCKCNNCGHEWDGHPRSMRRGAGCPNCRRSRPRVVDPVVEKTKRQTLAKNQRKSHEQFLLDAAKANPKLTITGQYINNKTKIDCQCKQCGYSWNMTPSNVLKGRGCPECSKTQTSCWERYVLFVMQRIVGDENVLPRDHTAIGSEIDIYLPNFQIGIEPGRWYWHKRKLQKDKEKYELCKQKGIRLITIYDEFNDSRESYDFNDDFITYRTKFGDDNTFIELRNCVINIFQLMGFDYCLSEKEERELFARAKTETCRKTTETMVLELSNINPNIEMLGHYRGYKTKVPCRCRLCGNEWESDYEHLIRRKQGCPKCNSHNKQVVNLDTGEIFESIKAAGAHFGVTGSAIGNACHGRASVCRGYHWAFLKDLSESQLDSLRTQFPDTFKY